MPEVSLDKKKPNILCCPNTTLLKLLSLLRQDKFRDTPNNCDELYSQWLDTRQNYVARIGCQHVTYRNIKESKIEPQSRIRVTIIESPHCVPERPVEILVKRLGQEIIEEPSDFISGIPTISMDTLPGERCFKQPYFAL